MAVWVKIEASGYKRYHGRPGFIDLFYLLPSIGVI